jgi:hypothetical protein
MAGKRKQPSPTKTAAAAAATTKIRSSPRKQLQQDDISDLSDDEHLDNEAVKTTSSPSTKKKKSPSPSPSSKKKKASSSPSIQRDHVEFPLSNITTHLTCQLCNGYYRDAHTIVDCLHTFCRSCLILYFDKQKRTGLTPYEAKRGYTKKMSCPTCQLEIGPHPFKALTSISTIQILPDRTLQEVVDKLFPRFKAREVDEEKKFYKERNIQLKAEYQQQQQQQQLGGDNGVDGSNNNGKEEANGQKSASQSNFHGTERLATTTTTTAAAAATNAQSTTAMAAAITSFMKDTIIELRLHPDTTITSSSITSTKKSSKHHDGALPALKNPILRTSGKLKISSLKKYLVQQLDMKRISGDGGVEKDMAVNDNSNSNDKNMIQSIEILCNGYPMGNELNLTFIYRTMWLVTMPEEVLTLTYRLGSEDVW